MEPRIVIVAYKPKPGKENELMQLALEHYPTLKDQGLVTDRTPILMKAKDGTIIEVFEWKSHAAIEQAHTNKPFFKCGRNTTRFVNISLLEK